MTEDPEMKSKYLELSQRRSDLEEGLRKLDLIYVVIRGALVIVQRRWTILTRKMLTASTQDCYSQNDDRRSTHIQYYRAHLQHPQPDGTLAVCSTRAEY